MPLLFCLFVCLFVSCAGSQIFKINIGISVNGVTFQSEVIDYSDGIVDGSYWHILALCALLKGVKLKELTLQTCDLSTVCVCLYVLFCLYRDLEGGWGGGGCLCGVFCTDLRKFLYIYERF